MKKRSTSDLHEQAVAARQFPEEEAYWLKKLAGEILKTTFPYDRRKSQNRRNIRIPESFRFKFTGDHFLKLMKLSNDSDYRLHMILTALLAAVLYKYTARKDILVGTPVLKQDFEAEFINTVLALRCRISSDEMTFKELLLEVRQTVVEANENQNYPLTRLSFQLGIPFSKNDDFPLFDMALLVKNIQEKNYIRHININIIFSFLKTDEAVEGEVEYNSELYHRASIERIIVHFTHVLEEVLSNVDLRLLDINMASPEEKKQLLFDFNDTEADYPRHKTVHGLFADQVERTPDHIAVIGRSAGSVRHAITYRELNEKSGRLVYGLKERGVGPDVIAAIMMERSIEMIIGILAILKTGGAYLPVEPAYPKERIDYMLKDSGARVLLSGLSEVSEGTEAVTHPTHPTHLCYIIYTSGSTGRPKGVPVEHRSAVNTLVCRKEAYKLTPGHISLQLFAYAFDGFVTSFFTPVISGAAAVLLSDEEILDMAKLKDAIVKNGITHFISIPILYQAIIEALTREEAAALEVVTLAGDDVSPHVLETTKQRNPGMEIANEYGVTECAVMSTICRHLEKEDRISIGKPVWNTQVYILNHGGILQAIGVSGELCISGAGLARGYLNNPELTNEKFLRGSRGQFFQKEPPGRRRLYKTGDLARWLPDGVIEFLGRIDRQVKIRGFRVELGEIENQLHAHPFIKNAVVLTKENDRGDKYLLAYVVPNKEFNISEIRRYLLMSLPVYMIPASFVELDRMPVTPNGKIDRQALSGLAGNIKMEAEYEEPRDGKEKKLAEIWRDMLGLERVGRKDNFFNIGGDSIKTISILNVVNEAFAVELEILDLYQNETIEKLADAINKRKTDRHGEESGDILEDIENLKNRFMNEL